MKKTIIGLALTASLMLAACGNSQDEVIVTTASGDITKDEFYEQIKELAGTSLLEQVVIEKILNEKYDVTDKEVEEQFSTYKDMYGDSFETALASNGYTEETFKDTVRFQLLQQKAMEDVEITDEEINTYYERGKYELHTRHIVAETEEEAQQFYDLIAEGNDFETVAKEKSQDSATAENGGDLDWLAVADMDTAFAQAAYALEAGEVSKVIETASGYEIIQLVEKREVADYKALEDQRDEVIAAVKDQKVANTEWSTIEAKLLKEMNVEVKDEDLKEAFSETLGTNEE
ncbi:peptidylprolyl isomerase [Solibacillus daqui]|uniref:peptidylprolyl isomerase n=1 Tax=Solibacillus daqui TaxID=2912187 RepID=UPI002367225D|nr:peptidylprolyl isomerase [Solibacillus daqui]